MANTKAGGSAGHIDLTEFNNGLDRIENLILQRIPDIGKITEKTTKDSIEKGIKEGIKSVTKQKVKLNEKIEFEEKSKQDLQNKLNDLLKLKAEVSTTLSKQLLIN